MRPYPQYDHSEFYIRNVAEHVYQQLFLESLPHFDFKNYFGKNFRRGKPMRKPYGDSQWYLRHYLPMNRQHALIELLCEIYPLSKNDKMELRRFVFGTYPPNSNYYDWKERTEKIGLPK